MKKPNDIGSYNPRRVKSHTTTGESIESNKNLDRVGATKLDDSTNGTARINVDVDTDEDYNHNSDSNDVSFLKYFLSTNGPPQIIFVCFLYALSIGSSVGVIPSVMMDRYARLNHNFDGYACSSYGNDAKPVECSLGSDDAQGASAIEGLVKNSLAFLTSSMIGSISDLRGRKGLLVLGFALSLIGPSLLVAIQVKKSIHPFWYYAGRSVSGVINWMTIALSSLSDALPPQWRAPSFGLLFAGFSAGFCLSPTIAIPLGHFYVSVVSLVLSVFCFLFLVIYVPETLPLEVSREALRQRREQQRTIRRRWLYFLTRPFRELAILNRSHLFHLLAALAFLNGVVGTADQSLLLYYIENRLYFHDKDVALLFFLIGILGLIIQGSMLKTLIDLLGERRVLMVGFLGGVFNNTFYGLARSKAAIYIGAAFGSLTMMTFPVISAIKANNVDVSEQGRIQGALFSLQCLSSALGPVSLNHVYTVTKDWAYPGPGTMFFFAGFLYLIAVYIVTLLPQKKTDSRITISTSMPSMKGQHRNGNESDTIETSYGSMDSQYV